MRKHLGAVRSFMNLAGQACPPAPIVPPPEVRELRARLIVEEAFETATALGVRINVDGREYADADTLYRDLSFVADGEVDLVGVADGCADVLVVTTGTAIACGIDLEPVQYAVDESNLAKFKEGGHLREDGKWIKPPDWKAPDLAGILGAQLLPQTSPPSPIQLLSDAVVNSLEALDNLDEAARLADARGEFVFGPGLVADLGRATLAWASFSEAVSQYFEDPELIESRDRIRAVLAENALPEATVPAPENLPPYCGLDPDDCPHGDGGEHGCNVDGN